MANYKGFGSIAKSSLIRGSIVYGTSSMLSRAIPFFLLPVLTHYLSPSQFGLVSSIFVIQAVLSIVLDFGVSNYVSINYYQRHEQLPIIFSEAIAVYVGMSLVSIPVCLLADLLKPGIFQVSKVWIVCMVVSTGMRLIYNMLMMYWQLEQRPFLYLIFQNLSTLFETLFTLLFVIGFRFGWEGRAGSNFLVGGIAGLFSIFFFVKKFDLKIISNSYRQILSVAIDGSPMIMHGVGAWLITSMDRYLVTAFVSPYSGGIYSLASQMASIVGFITAAFNQAWAPYLYKTLSQNIHGSKQKLVKITYIYALTLIMICIACYIAFAHIIPLIFARSYGSATKYLPLMLGQMFFWGMYYMVTNYVFYAKKTRRLALVTLANGVFSFAINMIAIPRYGAWGCAFAGLISSCSYFFSVLYLSNKSYPMPWLKCWRSDPLKDD